MAGEYIDVPGFPGLRAEASQSTANQLVLFYTGEIEQLVTAGIVPAAALVRWVPGAKKGRVDFDGDKVNVELYFGSAGGVPKPRARVILRKSMARGLQLPGALEAWRRFKADQARFEPERVVELALARVQAMSSTRH